MSGEIIYTMSINTKGIEEGFERARKKSKDITDEIANSSSSIERAYMQSLHKMSAETANLPKPEMGAVKESFQNAQTASQEYAKSLLNMSASERDVLKASESVGKALEDARVEMRNNEAALKKLKVAWSEMGQLQGQASKNGDKKGAEQISSQRDAIRDEIELRTQLQNELRQNEEALNKVNEGIEENIKKVQSSKGQTASMKRELRDITMQMAQMEQAGKRNTAEYVALSERAGQLSDAMGDAARQVSLMANDDLGLAGVASAASGVSGAFSAATGAMSLMGDESADLQKTLVKLQSVMAITNGLQQVAATLNKDSAARIGIISKFQAAFTKAKAASVTTTTADTAATIANTAAQDANNRSIAQGAATETADTAQKAANTTITNTATAAHLTFGGAIKAVGVALKSLLGPFGIVVTLLGGIVAAIMAFTSESRRFKKIMEEIQKAAAESSAKVEVSFSTLASSFAKLNTEAERAKWIKEHQKDFDELGVSIKNAAEAQALFTDENKNTAKGMEAAKTSVEQLKAKYAEQQAALEKFEREIGETRAKIDEGISNRESDIAKWRSQGMSDNNIATFTRGKYGWIDAYENDVLPRMQKNYERERNKTQIDQIKTQIEKEEKTIVEAREKLGIKVKEVYEDSLKQTEWFIDQESALESKRISNLYDGGNKSRQQIEQSYKEEIAAIQKERESMERERGGEAGLTDREKAIFTAREQLASVSRQRQFNDLIRAEQEQREDLIRETTSKTISAMVDGVAKEKAQIEQNYQDTLAAIERKRQEDHRGGNYSNDAMYKRQEEAAMAEKLKQTKAMELRSEEELQTLRNTIEDNRISMMEDGFSKEMATLHAQYERKKRELDKQERELAEGNEGGVLTDQQRTYYDKQREQNEASYQQSLIKLQLTDYERMQQQKLQLTTDYNAKVAAAESMQGAEQRESHIQQLKQEYEQAMKSINQSESEYALKYSATLQKAFSDMEARTREGLKQSIRTLEQMKQRAKDRTSSVKGVSDAEADAVINDPEKLAEAYQRLRDLQDEMNANNPFGAIISGLSGMFKNTKKEIDALEGVDDEYKTILKQQAELDKKSATSSFISGLQGGASALSGMASAFSDIAANIPELQGAAETLEEVDTVLSNTASYAAAGAQIGGAYGAIAGAVVGLVSGFAQIWESSSMLMAQNKADMEDFVKQCKAAELELQDIYDGIFGTKSISKAIDAYSKAFKALDGYKAVVKRAELVNNIVNNGFDAQLPADISSSGKSLSEYKRQIDEVSSSLKEYSGVQTKSQKWFKIGSVDRYTQLKDYNELWKEDGTLDVENAKLFLETQNNLNSSTREMLQNIVDTNEQYDELIKSLDEGINTYFGSWSTDITNAIYDSIYNGADAWDTFEQMGTKAIAEIGKQMANEFLVSAYLDTKQDQLREAFANMNNDNGSSLSAAINDTISGLGAVMENVEVFNDKWKAAAESNGYDIAEYYKDNSTSKQGLSGAIATASQESIDLLAGQTNAVRVNQVKSIEILEASLKIQSEMNAGIVTMGGFLRQIQASNDTIAASCTKMANSSSLRSSGITG